MKSLVRTLIILGIFVPSFAFAQTGDMSVQQIEELLNRILQLQQQMGAAGGAGVGGSSECPRAGVTLKPGSNGEDVRRLQAFLARDTSVYPEGLITGYYGALTQAAVGRWQAKNGIVSSGTPATNGFGVFGPRTAAALALQCSGGGSSAPTSSAGETLVGGFIKVSPVSGAAPLTVSVEATVNSVRSCQGATYTLSWGDNSATHTIIAPPNQCEVLSQTYSHVYTQTGTYSITLSSGGHQTSSTIVVGGTGAAGASGTGATSGTSGTSLTGGSASTGGTNSGTGTGTGGSTATASGQVTIQMTPNSYTPADLKITKGTKVTWTNTDSMVHTVSADNSSYNSGSLSPGQSYSLTFSIPGEYTYFCAFHGGPGGVGMSGRIVVE